MTPQRKRQITLEIYNLIRQMDGAILQASGFMGKNDSSKLSRQINPTDEQKDKPFVEVLEILEAFDSFAPVLEEAIWQVIERERNGVKLTANKPKRKLAELINKVFTEQLDVNYANNTGASQEHLEQQAFEAVKAAEEQYKEIVGRRGVAYEVGQIAS